MKKILQPGIGVALLSALLFGASSPIAKLFLNSIPPVLLAGLLYMGSGVGLSVLYFWKQKRPFILVAGLRGSDLLWLLGAVFFGGVLGPILLMSGLSVSPASSASLLLNLESVFTALIAWFVMHENFDKRIIAGMLSIVLGGVLLSWQGGAQFTLGSLLVAGACLCWGIDNNLTQKISDKDPVQIASIKGLISGIVTIAIGLTVGQSVSIGLGMAGAMAVGFFGYGVSLVFFVVALRSVGTARTSAYFSLAPFVGAVIALLLFKEPVTLPFLGSSVLMAIGLWLHLSERHSHLHEHEALEHEHSHTHDEHHQHIHPAGMKITGTHTHMHTHEKLAHEHPHFPDIHHRHKH